MKLLWQRLKRHESPEGWYLLILTFGMAFSLDGWMALINNFSIEQLHFTGAEIGQLQSVREIPGFLSFLAVYLLLWFLEQRLALFFLLLMGIGCAVTGVFASYWGLMLTTTLMSIGFHYYETYNQSLSLQWVSKDRLPRFMGKMSAVTSFGGLFAYGMIWFLISGLDISYQIIYIILGLVPIIIVIFAMMRFPIFSQGVVQHKKFLLRKRYSLYYLLTFFAGARRQIFVVFGGFLMVERFGMPAEYMALLFLINHSVNLFLAPFFGWVISVIGERRALIIEYGGLTMIFIGYALVDNVYLAIFLYLGDHMFFSLRIAIKSYFQKIADPADTSATMAVSYTINHIAAVALPVLLGIVWLFSNAIVFYIAAGLAVCSLVLSLFIPRHPTVGNETILKTKTVR